MHDEQAAREDVPHNAPRRESPPQRVRLVELGLVLATAAAFALIPKPPDASLPLAVFIPVCIISWGAFLVWRLRGDPNLAAQWGLRPSTNLRPLVLRLGPLMALFVALGAAYAVATDAPLLPKYLALSMLLYPLWGLIQQWLVQALLVDNVRALTGARLPWLMLLGSVGFGIVHFQHPTLVLATAAMGAVYVVLFQRWRNLWPLAVCHGWLGSLFYPWVLGLNPLAEMLAGVG